MYDLRSRLQVYYARGLPHGLLHGGEEVENRVRRLRSDVKHFPVCGRIIDSVGNRPGNIGDVRESTGLFSITENGAGLVVQDLVHEDPDHVPIPVSCVLPFPVHIVRTKHDIVESEHPPRGGQVELHRILGDAVGVLRFGPHGLDHRHLTRAIDRDTGGEDETLYVVIHAGVHHVHGANNVVGVVETPDEMAQAFGGVGGQMKHVVESMLTEHALHYGRVGAGPPNQPYARWYVLFEPSGQIVEDHDLVA